MAEAQPQEAQKKKEPDEKTKKRIRLGCAAIIAIIAIAVIISLISPGGKTEESSPTVTSTPIRITAGELYSAYDENEVSADAKYEDKILKVQGVVKSVGKDIIDTAYVVLTTGAEHEMWGVQCMFDTEYESQLAQLSKGQVITIQGRCSGYLINVLLRDCVLVD